MKGYVDRNGFEFCTKRWDVGYWLPWAWKPLSIREGRHGRKGWWGALQVIRLDNEGRPS